MNTVVARLRYEQNSYKAGNNKFYLDADHSLRLNIFAEYLSGEKSNPLSIEVKGNLDSECVSKTNNYDKNKNDNDLKSNESNEPSGETNNKNNQTKANSKRIT